MRLLYQFRFQQIGETYLAAATGQNAHLFNGVLQLNEVGHFIVSELAKLRSAEENDMSTDSTELTDKASTDSTELTEAEIIHLLTGALTNEYAVDSATAQSAVQQVLDYLKAEQVLA